MREIDSAGAIPHLTVYARKLWPILEGVRWTHAWGGRLAMTRDHYPHVHEPAARSARLSGLQRPRGGDGDRHGAALARRITQPERPFDMPVTDMKPIAMHPLWPAGGQSGHPVRAGAATCSACEPES